MISWCCSPARGSGCSPHGGADATPSLVVSAAQRLSGAGAVPGTGRCLLSAPDAYAGELGLVVEAWPGRAPHGEWRVVRTARPPGGRSHAATGPHGAGPPPGDRRPGRGSGHRAGPTWTRGTAWTSVERRRPW